MELPLLTKELNEQAQRRRTYVFRITYAAILFAIACSLFYGNLLRSGATGAGSLGRGRQLFEWLVYIQFWGILLILPAMTSGSIAIEKERHNLGLLILTGMRSWEIVLQKLLSRLIPMYTFLFLSLPLMAVAYSFGGLTEQHLWVGILLVMLTCLQVGCLSIMCSAYFRTTVEAFGATYLLYALFTVTISPFGVGTNVVSRMATASTFQIVFAFIPTAISIVATLVLSCVFLEKRALVPPRNVLIQFFRALDRIYVWANRITGDVMIAHDKNQLPDDEPVAWRETAKKSLGTVRYLFRVLVAMELPILILIQLMQGPGTRHTIDAFSNLLYTLWGIAVVLIAAYASSVFVSERTRQNLEVLLATPLTGRELILQKFRGVQRLIYVLSIPFLTIYVFEWWWNGWGSYVYMILSIPTIAIFLPLVGWFAVWRGLESRSQIKTIIVTVGLIALVLIVPVTIRYVVASVLRIHIPVVGQYLLFLSPVDIIRGIETGNPVAVGLPDPPWACYALSFLTFLGLLMWLRKDCLRNADRYLGRLSEPDLPDASHAPTSPHSQHLTATEDTDQPEMETVTIFDMIGETGFSNLVAAFYRRIPADSLLGPMYPADEMESAEKRLRDFLIYRFGGPQHYLTERGHPRLRMRHAPFTVDQKARDRWIELMDEALIETALPAEVEHTLKSFFNDTASFLRND